MGTPNTVDICGACRNPIIQWNNTGAWEHLGSARMDQAESRAYVSGAKSMNLVNNTICNSPVKALEQSNTAGLTVGSHRTARKV